MASPAIAIKAIPIARNPDATLQGLPPELRLQIYAELRAILFESCKSDLSAREQPKRDAGPRNPRYDDLCRLVAKRVLERGFGTQVRKFAAIVQTSTLLRREALQMWRGYARERLEACVRLRRNIQCAVDQYNNTIGPRVTVLTSLLDGSELYYAAKEVEERSEMEMHRKERVQRTMQLLRKYLIFDWRQRLRRNLAWLPHVVVAPRALCRPSGSLLLYRARRIDEGHVVRNNSLATAMESRGAPLVFLLEV